MAYTADKDSPEAAAAAFADMPSFRASPAFSLFARPALTMPSLFWTAVTVDLAQPTMAAMAVLGLPCLVSSAIFLSRSFFRSRARTLFEMPMPVSSCSSLVMASFSIRTLLLMAWGLDRTLDMELLNSPSGRGSKKDAFMARTFS